jgi:hypothetical protein
MNTIIRFGITTFATMSLMLSLSAGAVASPRADIPMPRTKVQVPKLIALKTEAPAPAIAAEPIAEKPNAKTRAIFAARRELLRRRLSLALRS